MLHYLFNTGWVEVNRREDLPIVGERCLFELKTGFRFYGERADWEQIVCYLYHKRYSWIAIRQWKSEPLPEGFSRDSKTGAAGRG